MITDAPVAPGEAVPAPAPSPKTSKRQFDSRYVAPLLITTILLIGQMTYGVLESYPQTLLAIVSCIATEVVLSRWLYGKWPHLASAYVSGISVGILIRSPLFWPFVVCGILSIASKYVLNWKGRHLWNPSNFGISAMLFLAPAIVSSLSQQFGNDLAPMLLIWALGAFIVWRLKRLHICATYVLSFFAFAALRAAFHPAVMTFTNAFHAEVGPITGPVYQLFTFFMITDPKSTVHGRRAQCLVAFAIAAAECVLRVFHNIHAPYYALFLVGPIANVIEIARTKKAAPAPRPAPAA